MASDDTTTLLDEAYIAAVRQLADHDVVEVYQVACGQGPIAELAPAQMQSRRLDI